MSLYSIEHFRIYEPYLAAIADAWPTPVVFDRKMHSISTLDSRLRICSRVLLTNPTLETTIDKAKWTAIAPELRLSQIEVLGKLWCGPRSAASKVAPRRTIIASNVLEQVEEPPPVERKKVTLSVADNMPEDSLKKLLAFVADGWCEPVTIFTNLPLEVIAQSFDVQVKVKGPGTYQVL